MEGVHVCAAVVWSSFIIHYQSFWIDSCNFGNGAKNIIFASLFVSLVLVMICWAGRVDQPLRTAPSGKHFFRKNF